MEDRKAERRRIRKKRELPDAVNWKVAFRNGIRIGIPLLMLELCLLGGLLIREYINSDTSFRVKRITISGNEHVPTEQIRFRAGIREGINIFQVNQDDLERRIVGDRRIESARVEKRLFDEITIHVKERKPVMGMVIGREFFLVDKKGEIFSWYTELGEMSLPLLRMPGDSREILKTNRLSDRETRIVTFVARILSPRSMDSVSEIVPRERGDVELYTVSPVVRVRFNLETLERGLKRYDANLDLILDWAREDREIDLRFEDIVVLPRNA